jgi:hypothetical protein
MVFLSMIPAAPPLSKAARVGFLAALARALTKEQDHLKEKLAMTDTHHNRPQQAPAPDSPGGLDFPATTN